MSAGTGVAVFAWWQDCGSGFAARGGARAIDDSFGGFGAFVAVSRDERKK